MTGGTEKMDGVYWRLELGPPEPARHLAIALLGLPTEELLPSRMDRIAGALIPTYLPGSARGAPLPGAYRLSGWLWWIAAPGRVVLEVHLEGVVRERSRIRGLDMSVRG